MVLKRQDGFSLMEVMVAGSLLAALSYAGIKLMTDQSRAQKSVESRAEITALLTDMRTILSKEQSCIATFQNRNINTPEGTVTYLISQEYFPATTPPASQPPKIQRYHSNTNPNAGKFYGNGNVKILGYRLDGSVNSLDGTGNFATGPSGNKVGAINLHVRFYVGKNRAQSAEVVTRKILLNVEKDASDKIIRCTAAGGVGIEGRYLQRLADSDASYRTMKGDLLMESGAHIIMGDNSHIIMGTNSEIRFPSDKNLKYDIKSIRNTLSKVKQLRPVTYKWKSSHAQESGLIAQEVEKVFPELVAKTENGHLSVNYIKLTPLLIKATQELDAENTKLRKSLDHMQAEQKQLRDELELLRKHICQTSSSSEVCN